MGPMNGADKRKSPAKVIVAVAAPIAVAVACFTVILLLPESDKPFFDSPLRSVLAGAGLLAASCPLLLAGSRLRRHAAGSPYYEEGFIAGFLTLVGYILLIVGLLCLALAAYALIERLITARWPARGARRQ